MKVIIVCPHCGKQFLLKAKFIEDVTVKFREIVED